MSVAGIYPASRAMSPSTSGSIPQLSEREAELLEQLPETARTSRPVTHAELHAAVVAMAERHNYSLELEVVANVRGTGDETFYCQYDDESLSRQLAQELARRCGPQIVLPSTGEDGVLVLPEA